MEYGRNGTSKHSVLNLNDSPSRYFKILIKNLSTTGLETKSKLILNIA